MQKHGPPFFLCTSTTALHHGFWLGWIVPTSINISSMWAWTSSTIDGGILWNLSLKGSFSMTLISCFARSVHPNSPGSKEKMPWHSSSRAHVVAWFLVDHPSRPDNPAAGRALPFSTWLTSLLSGSLAFCWASLTFLVRLQHVVRHSQLWLKWS